MNASKQFKESVHDQPGIYYDGQLRLFRLRCKNSLYAFRVDDARNLEHLYWGPPLTHDDDITYLIRSHVPAPFDPKGTVSVAKIMGLDELAEIEDFQELSDKWKIYTRQHDEDDPEGDKRSRRLENASWRIWHRERNRGGDLSDPLSADAVADALKLEKRRREQSESPALDQPREPMANGAAQGRFSRPAHQPSAPGLKRGPGVVSMVNVAALGRESEFPSLTAPALDTPHARASPLQPMDRKDRLPSSSSSPKMLPKVPSTIYSPLAGSFGDLTMQEQATNWRELDPEVLGKNTKLLEFSDQGTGDYRDPSFKVIFSKDGSSVCPIEYVRHRIVDGKVMPRRMPALYTDSSEEATTLIVEMEDRLTGLRFALHYTVMHDYDIITRRTVVVNSGKDPVTLNHIYSGTFDFDAESQFYMTHLAGGWARERDVITQKLEYGTNVVKSSRGASSHQFNPHIVIHPGEEATEDRGECFGFTLVYSGNFAASCEITEYGRLRVNMGINPEGFTWYLDTKRETNTFRSPEVVMSYSNAGVGGLSRTLHRVFRERLIPRQWRYKIPPVLINTWEAAYFDVNHEIVVSIASAAAKADIEMLVLDDGWFGQRNDTRSGLGDWYPNLDKFPRGLKGIARDVNQIGLKFGIWVEPEMVSMNSDLYRAHPEWCLCVPERKLTTGRNQLVLDFSRKEVQDHIYNELHKMLNSANIEYVKWDMNRHLTEVFSQQWDRTRQGEIAHRFILGVYEVFRRLTEAFPQVLFESCSGGGGRFDAGFLYYSPQIWTSDNTDALSRSAIQYGTSLAYPCSAMGAHVSTVPNHQTHRSTPMKTRSIVAMSGTFGYELDPRTLTSDEIKEIKGYIELQKRIAPLVYEGDMYRLWSPFKSNSAAWMFVSRDQKRAVVMGINIRRIVGRLLPRLKLRGLCPNTKYEVEELCPGTLMRNNDTGAIEHVIGGVYQYGEKLHMTGKTLQNAGLPVKFIFDADSVLIAISAVPGDQSSASVLN
ncbi:Alpha-galactosidase AgaA [Gracilariopsis chorda]|uniref:alpha-galactosidase n=2 Tax=Gracilariopsis TaxID=2781 RepID=A0A2V3IPI5_9FLOR|nr:alpha galactosidase I [Gracilariopsis lemaneiformis]PXF43996.1 Alpha-galactosidase AgaA [Gracilariopsis chorda]|eukprot:PXF43996.1 Alpha-galactosidase AgaA [Gracilariopsis chorda]